MLVRVARILTPGNLEHPRARLEPRSARGRAPRIDGGTLRSRNRCRGRERPCGGRRSGSRSRTTSILCRPYANALLNSIALQRRGSTSSNCAATIVVVVIEVRRDGDRLGLGASGGLVAGTYRMVRSRTSRRTVPIRYFCVDRGRRGDGSRRTIGTCGAPHEPGHVLAGTVYRVIRHLATGGMGSVYDVEDIDRREALRPEDAASAARRRARISRAGCGTRRSRSRSSSIRTSSTSSPPA